MGCKGSLKEVSDKDLQNGYSKAHLKSMYGITKPVTIKGTSESFTDMVIAGRGAMSTMPEKASTILTRANPLAACSQPTNSLPQLQLC